MRADQLGHEWIEVAHQFARRFFIIPKRAHNQRGDIEIISHVPPQCFHTAQYDSPESDLVTTFRLLVSAREQFSCESCCNRRVWRAVIISRAGFHRASVAMKTILPLAVVLLSTLTAQADLKSWLHGTPAPSTPAPPDATAASVSFASGVAPDKQILDFLVAFAEAVRLHDGAALKPRLSEQYVIEDMPEGQSAVDFFMQAMAKIKAPNEMIVISVEPAGDLREAKVEFHSQDRPPKTRTFRFDSAGKLVSADFFSLQRHGFFGH